jgi:hypothetical protein
MQSQPAVSLDIIFSVIIGGAITLIGSLLATVLEERRQARNRRRDRTIERYLEVRGFIQASLEFADIAYQPRKLGPELFGQGQAREWLEDLRGILQQWRTLPVRGSARALYVDDEELLKLLGQLDNLTFLFYLNAKELFDRGRMADLDDKLTELRNAATAASQRLDELIVGA